MEGFIERLEQRLSNLEATPPEFQKQVRDVIYNDLREAIDNVCVSESTNTEAKLISDIKQKATELQGLLATAVSEGLTVNLFSVSAYAGEQGAQFFELEIKREIPLCKLSI